MSSVPQFIGVEDKIVGPLTWKQLGWMIGMGAMLLVVYSFTDTALFIILGIPIAFIFLVFAFYKPNGFPFTTFVFYFILFLFRPKIAVWKKSPPKQQNQEPKVQQPKTPIVVKKSMEREKLASLAHILDHPDE